MDCAAVVGVVALLLEVFKFEQSGLRRPRKKAARDTARPSQGGNAPKGTE